MKDYFKLKRCDECGGRLHDGSVVIDGNVIERVCGRCGHRVVSQGKI